MPYISFVVNVTPPVYQFYDSPVFHSEKDENILRQALKPFVYGLSRFVVIILYGHTSTTYKLKLNKGDMKAVQGDTGHAQLKMVSDVYSHILDEDRRQNASRFEQEFYHTKDSKPIAQSKLTVLDTPKQEEAQKVMELLANSPELTAQLLQMLSQGKKGMVSNA